MSGRVHSSNVVKLNMAMYRFDAILSRHRKKDNVKFKSDQNSIPQRRRG